jgi:hypothetical protein
MDTTLTRDLAVKTINDSGIFAFVTAKAGDVPGVVLLVEDRKLRGSFRIIPEGKAQCAGLRRLNSVAAKNVKDELEKVGFEVVD